MHTQVVYCFLQYIVSHINTRLMPNCQEAFSPISPASSARSNQTASPEAEAGSAGVSLAGTEAPAAQEAPPDTAGAVLVQGAARLHTRKRKQTYLLPPSHPHSHSHL